VQDCHEKDSRKSSSYGGVFPVTVFTVPADCGGSCLYCPQEKGMPRGYVSNRSLRRALNLGFDPVLQVRASTETLLGTRACGALPLEVIILGGSFSALGQAYRLAFMSQIYGELGGYNAVQDAQREEDLFRCSILTVECRPDQITDEECIFMRKLGVSKVELGVQHLIEHVLEANNRGHGVEAVRKATFQLKQHGFKVGYHVMVGLPGSTIADDIWMLSEGLWQTEYSPDFLKVYPCALLKDVELQPELHSLYRAGKWAPPTVEHVRKLLAVLASAVPPYVRVARVGRMFGEHDHEVTSYRGIREDRKHGCRCIRCREVGQSKIADSACISSPTQFRVTNLEDEWICEALGDRDILLGLVRLRFRGNSAAVIREIHVYGAATAVGTVGQVQGHGIGGALLERAEVVALNNGTVDLFVNAAVGARSFFRDHGYFDSKDGYLMKHLVRDL